MTVLKSATNLEELLQHDLQNSYLTNGIKIVESLKLVEKGSNDAYHVLISAQQNLKNVMQNAVNHRPVDLEELKSIIKMLNAIKKELKVSIKVVESCKGLFSDPVIFEILGAANENPVPLSESKQLIFSALNDQFLYQLKLAQIVSDLKHIAEIYQRTAEFGDALPTSGTARAA